MADILQTKTFLSAFSRHKIVVLWLKFCWKLFQMGQLNIKSSIVSDDLVLNQQHAIVWTNDGQVYWNMYYPVSMCSTALRHLFTNEIATVIQTDGNFITMQACGFKTFSSGQSYFSFYSIHLILRQSKKGCAPTYIHLELHQLCL